MSIFSRTARETPDNPPSATSWMPYVEAPQGETPVVLSSLEVHAVITGLHAETSQTMVLHNPNHRDLEGSLVFPLPDDAVVCGYALDVDGMMVDGVVVPKQEARRILEAEERKGADPGLIEKVQGNLYRTRIYPIPGRGSRKVRITYVSELTVKDRSAAYHLPLRHAGQLDKVALRVEVVQAPVEPIVSGGLGNLTMNRWQERWVAEATLSKGTPSEDLQVRLPDLPESFTVVEETGDGEVFFCISARLPEIGRKDEDLWAPVRIAIAWDASGSRRNIERDLQLVRALAAEWSDLIVDVMVFRERIDRVVRTFQVSEGRADELVEYLTGLAYDGGTSLAALDLATTPHADDEAWLLFSDGMGTVEVGLPRLGKVAVFAVTGQADGHAARLGHIARETGGIYVNLLRTDAEAACASICQYDGPAWKLGDIRSCNAVHCSAASGRMMVLGRLDGGAGVGSVALHGPDAPAFELRADDAERGQIIARAWAGTEAAVLELGEPDEAADEMLALGRRYGLVTPGSSLLVLESLEQYLEYRIEPPATLPEMLAAYRRTIADEERREDERKHKQLDAVLALWERRVSWWATDYRPHWPQPDGKRESARRGDSNDRGGMDAPRMMPASMAAPAPPAPAPPGSAPPMDEMIDLCEPEAADYFAAEETRREAERVVVDACLEEAEFKEEADEGRAAGAQATIRIQPWTPSTPYLTAMKAADDAYRAYLGQRDGFAASPAFYLDCGDFLLTAGDRDRGLRVLSNLLELGLDDPALMRMYAWRLRQAGELDRAIAVLERVRKERDDEPQSHRDLALALGERWERDGVADDAVRAMELFYDVVLRAWDRFPEIELLVLMELNRLVHRAERAGIAAPEIIDRRLLELLDLDVRISMSWDADLTDVDLHVFEPHGEHAYYGHNLTTIGGLVSRDFTQGYGPEEYVLRRALPGTYTIKAHYYGSSQQDVCGPCTVIVNAFTNYGRADEDNQVLTLRLDKPSDQVLVGEITIAGAARPEPRRAEEADWRGRFARLSRGMSVTEITGLVGQPAEITGEDEMILVFRPTADVRVHVHASPRLTAVRAIMDGATLDLV